MCPENKDRETSVYYSTICKWTLRSFDRRTACSIQNIVFKENQSETNSMLKSQSEGKIVTVYWLLLETYLTFMIM